MSDTFDPYHRWLGISRKDQPPDHYRLLGVERFESSAEAIEHAADRQMAHLRTLQRDEHVEAAQQILNEVSAARVCLLHPAKKAQYDQRLRRQMVSAGPPQAALRPAPGETAAAPEQGARVADALRRKRRSSGARWVVAVVVTVLLAVGTYLIVTWDARETAENPDDQVDIRQTETTGPSTDPSEPVGRAETVQEDRTEQQAHVTPGPTAPDPPRDTLAPSSPAPPPSLDAPEDGPEPQPEPEPDQAIEVLPDETAALRKEAAVASAPDVPGKAPVPDAEAQSEAKTLVADVYRAEYEKAEAPSQKIALAERLMVDAAQMENEPASRFVLLEAARTLAIQAGSSETALKAIDETAGMFQIEPFAVKLQTLLKLAETVRFTTQRRALAASALKLIDEAVVADDFPSAERLAEMALAAAQRARDGALTKQIKARQDAIKQTADEYAEVQEALRVLEGNPDDAEANLAVGAYVCFTKGDWEKGLPMLASGSDAALKALARKELDGPASPDEQVELADGWWDLAEEKEGNARQQILSRAAHWYRRALPDVSGLTKLKVEKRIDELTSTLDQETSGVVPKEGSSRSTKSQPSQIVFLDDLPELAVSVGSGVLGKHGAKGWRGERIVFQGAAVTHALSTHPKSNGFSFVNYALKGRAEAFHASVAVIADAVAPLTFKVLGDGKVVWQSRRLRRYESQQCEARMRGVKLLTLQVHCHGDQRRAHAVWIDPYVKVRRAGALQEKSADKGRRGRRRHLLPGLVGEYFQGKNFQKQLAVRIDDTVGLGWAVSQGSGIPKDYFSIRWSGWLVAPVEGSYVLMVRSDDGHRVWLDGRVIADKWRFGGNARSDVSVTLDREPHSLMIEYFDSHSAQMLALRWRPPGADQPQNVPASALFHTKGPLDK